MGAALEMMRCDRRSLTLTTQGCAKLWQSANAKPEPAPWEGRFACLRCPVGAGLAGASIAPTADAAAALHRVCPRCFRPTQRMIRDRLCVSCYNRQREADQGRNAKGNRPKISALLHIAHLAVSSGSRVRLVQEEVVELPEAMMAEARHATGRLVFAAPVPRFDAAVRLRFGGAVPVWAPQMELGL